MRGGGAATLGVVASLLSVAHCFLIPSFPAPGQAARTMGRARTVLSAAEKAAAPAAAPTEAELSTNMKAMQKFAEKYCEITETYFCSDLDITATVIKGLAKHKEEYGAPLCPCRHYEDKAAEVSLAYWNCPCVPMRERKECHCMLFLNPGTPFAGDKQAIPEELLVEPPKQGSI
uniref:ferredoxin:thioredoxin reductase n=1 Tax=Pseudellipsoidion edaphicum TaxID=1431838 RepID=A0A3R5TZD8_9STRA|nr:plastid ferredoxin-thioredoxin reductase beta subunit [Pseudellipsoidion edaphicum]